jgi:hypothetical protein
MFSVEKTDMKAGYYKEFVDDLLKEYNFGIKSSAEKSTFIQVNPSINALIE